MHNLSTYWLKAEIPIIASALMDLSKENVIQDKVRLYVNGNLKWYMH